MLKWWIGCVLLYVLQSQQGKALEQQFERNGYSLYQVAAEHYDCSLFYSLRLTIQDTHNIEKLMTRLAEWDKIKLLRHRSEIYKLGDKIEASVHPLRFMGHIFSHPHLAKMVHKIYQDRLFKWPSFSRGLGKRLSKEADRDALIPYLRGFCQLVAVDIAHIERLVALRHWESMLKFLMQKSQEY